MADSLNDGTIFVGGGGEGYRLPQHLLLKYANRHGLIAGATGTGKTVTLQILAESLSADGVPVFMADVKGDLSGIGAAGSRRLQAAPGLPGPGREDRFCRLRLCRIPVTFWDLFGEQGHPIRTTVADMGPLLLARLMDLTDAQEGVLNIAFRVSDEEGLPLLDLKDLQALLVWVGENAKRSVAALRQCRHRFGRRRSSGSCWCWRTRAARCCSASRRWSWPT